MPAMQIAYHVEAGPTEMYEIDARSAVANFPKEWSFTPWSGSAPGESTVSDKPAIPDNWKDLSAAERIALARMIGKKGNFGAEKADLAIQEYIEAHPPAAVDNDEED